MKPVCLVLALALAAAAHAQQAAPQPGTPAGMPSVHDPSTVVRFHGLDYVYSTGRGIPFLSSPDGVAWTRQGSVFQQVPGAVHAAVPKNNGTDIWAPDILRLHGQFYLYYAVSSWGSFQSAIALATNPVLDPKDPAYKWTDRGIVVSSNGSEDLNAIDPGVILAPDGTLWICYGSYHGSIRLTQLDPATGLALHPHALGEAIATARESEAADIIFHDGFYYLFVNHGSCCKGKDSQYNIRVGRARAITGPYLDKHGTPLTQGGGSLFLAAHDHRIGPGHFGRLLDYDAYPATGIAPAGEPERFSLHYEADLTNNGRPTLDIRPLLWSTDGWPIAGDNLPEATYQILSRQSENTLVEGTPAGRPTVHLSRYLTLPNEQWRIAPAHGGFSKITDLATGDALQLPANGLVELAPYTAAADQLWRIEQFPDGSYRILNQATGLALTEGPNGTVTATPFTRDDAHLWTITTP
jgi:arabinan endo-1,5-alpha-L-arabinosidase